MNKKDMELLGIKQEKATGMAVPSILYTPEYVKEPNFFNRIWKFIVWIWDSIRP